MAAIKQRKATISRNAWGIWTQRQQKFLSIDDNGSGWGEVNRDQISLLMVWLWWVMIVKHVATQQQQEAEASSLLNNNNNKQQTAIQTTTTNISAMVVAVAIR